MRTVILVITFLLFTPLQSALAQKTVLSSDGVEVTIDNTSRIITIGGSITETVFALGFGEQVIATDQSSTFPRQVFSLERVPYVRTITSEGILALTPTLIIASDEASPKSALQQIRGAGTSLLLVDEEKSVESATKKIAAIGEALDAEAKADELINENVSQLAKASDLRNSLIQKPTVLFILAVRGSSSFMVAGTNTGAEQMINLAGGKNAFNSFEGYKTVSNESILAANPDYILVMENRHDEIKAGVERTPGVNQTTAVRKDQILSFDGNYLLGFGPRLGSAVLDLMKALHPELSISIQSDY